MNGAENSENAAEEKESARVEQLKNSLHYSVGKICEEMSGRYDVNFNQQFIATLADLTYRQIGSFAEDLEMFARHAKRTTIGPEDIKLLVRKSSSLAEHIDQVFSELASAKGPAMKKKSKKTKESATATDDA